MVLILSLGFKNRGGEWIESQDEIIQEIVGFYKELLGSPSDQTTQIRIEDLQSFLPKKVDHSKFSQLVCIPSVKEIKEALYSIPPDKSPGPDGFSSAFFRHHWDLVSNELVEAVESFFRNGKLLK